MTAIPSQPDIYATIGSTKTATDEDKPLQKGELKKLFKALSVDEKAQFVKFLKILKEIAANLDTLDKSTEKLVDAEVETLIILLIKSLRKGKFDTTLSLNANKILYVCLLGNGKIPEALDVFPEVKAIVGKRLIGIEVLSKKGFLDKLPLQKNLLNEYYKKISDAKMTLFNLLNQKDVPSVGAAQQFDLDKIYHYGTTLPIYFILTSCISKDGKCHMDIKNVDQKMKSIFGENYPADMAKDLIEFSLDFD